MLVIDAINDMLAYLGESPLDPTDPDYTEHPLYASALRVLDTSSIKVQSRGWWFNDRVATLEPVADAIVIPNTYISVAIVGWGRYADYTVRDGALFDLTNNTAVITSSLRAWIRELIPFAELPQTAAAYVAAHAATRFVRTYDGDRGKLADVKEDEASAYILFNADHIRNSRVNLHTTASMGPVIANTWYSRYQRT
jgi:hypothetical protein